MRFTTPSAIPQLHTHEGAVAKRISPYLQLRRSVLSCLFWEREAYESGEDIAARIERLADDLPTDKITALAVEARSAFHLRHVPLLLLLSAIKRGGPGVAEAITATIQRPDEMAELLALYWRNGRRPLSKQLKLGLAGAFAKFDAYSLAKYDREGPVRLRDVLFLAHPKPETPERAALYKQVAERSLPVPDTWEVALSGGADKRAAWERLLIEGKLGYMALLRNLRNVSEAGVNSLLVRKALLERKGAHRVLPFRYVAAARACPQYEPWIDQALCEAVMSMPSLPGKTLVLVDVSGSMNQKLSARSDLTRMGAAAALASVVNADLRMFSFSAGLDAGRYSFASSQMAFRYVSGLGFVRHESTPDRGKILVEVPPRRGMAGVDALIKSQHHGGTDLGGAIREANAIPHDRLIVITDEQSATRVPDPMAPRAYMINVASAQNGVGYGKWVHIDGFSEAVLTFIREYEEHESDWR